MPRDALYDQRPIFEETSKQPMTKDEFSRLVARTTSQRMRLQVMQDRAERVDTAGYIPDASKEDSADKIKGALHYYEKIRVPKLNKEAHRLGVESFMQIVWYRLDQVLNNPDAPIAPLQQSIRRLQTI